MDMINYSKKLIKDAGKKCYQFVVGKPNPAKLANFDHVDVFVIVACPENSLVDSKDFYKPIITPYELEIALTKYHILSHTLTYFNVNILNFKKRKISYLTR